MAARRTGSNHVFTAPFLARLSKPLNVAPAGRVVGTLLLAAGCAGYPWGKGPPPEPTCRGAPEATGEAVAPIQWHLPSAAGDRERLARWCAAVGTPVVLSEPNGPPAAIADSLAVISWNSHVGGGDLARLVSDLREGRLTGGRPVEHFVLLLQEAHRAHPGLPWDVSGALVPPRVAEAPASGLRKDIVRSARQLGLSLFYAPSMRNGVGAPRVHSEDRGNAILSTFPLGDLHAIELPFEAQRRVAVAAAIRGRSRRGEWELLVTSVHLDTRSSGTRALASFGAGRLRQAMGLLASLPRDLPLVLAGDLNSWSLESLESVVPFLALRFPQSPAAADEPTLSTAWGYARRVDHMFFRLPDEWSARYERVTDRYGSDHLPLLAWVVFGGESDGEAVHRRIRVRAGGGSDPQ